MNVTLVSAEKLILYWKHLLCLILQIKKHHGHVWSKLVLRWGEKCINKDSDETLS